MSPVSRRNAARSLQYSTFYGGGFRCQATGVERPRCDLSRVGTNFHFAALPLSAAGDSGARISPRVAVSLEWLWLWVVEVRLCIPPDGWWAMYCTQSETEMCLLKTFQSRCEGARNLCRDALLFFEQSSSSWPLSARSGHVSALQLSWCYVLPTVKFAIQLKSLEHVFTANIIIIVSF